MTARPAEVGDLRLATICVNATDMDRAAAFWSAALGYDGPGPIGAGDQFAKLSDPAGTGPDVLLQRAGRIPDDPAPVHLDLYTGDRDRHVDRLVALGATRPDSWDYPDEHDFIVLRDTEGNEFCVISV
ncbi:putative enzyme related to lactoylglutathione lyase [Kribbella amoyensis]|uniref:Putative enzyme related to lactoylglutathione lyase n=1 Tax=Kribbella amoyensis TaxID=996641 RepID=A0A561BUF2_9ACTN|nr:VOC family protein [Kribbella amoyensis]TWD82431.1 putative enzyme related to lactoylglutathione lyase [Kribbella amoyensis]